MYNISMRLKHFFFFLALIAIAVLAIIQFGQFNKFVEVLARLNVAILVLVVALRFLYYFFNTMYFQAYMSNYKKNLKFKSLFKNVVTMNFANTVFPTGGVSGIAVMRNLMRKQNVPANTTTVAQIFWMGFTVASFIILLLVSLLFLFLSKNIEQVSFRIILMALLVILAVSILISGIMFNRKFAEKIIFALTAPANKVLKKFNKKSLEHSRVAELIDRFYATLSDFKGDFRLLIKPFVWCFLTLSIDIASLYLVFVAFGEFPNPGIVIAAFLIALLASFISIVTFGIGAFEVGMVAMLVGLGLGFDLSFSASVVYRVIALWLFIPIGLYFYKRTILDEE